MRPDLVKTGISAAGTHDLDLVAGQELDAYVRRESLDAIQLDHALSPASPGQGNVALRTVPPPAWHFPDGTVAPLAAVAVDLADEPDPRSARIGNETVARLDEEMRLPR